MSMRSFVAKRRIILAAGIAVMALMLWITAADVRYWSMATNRNPNIIHVTEATYGGNCLHFAPAGGHANLVKIGNATNVASQSCSGTDVVCPFVVDFARLGDPAIGCDKDFVINWRCGTDQSVHQIELGAEAVQKIAWLSCPAQQ